MDLVTCPAFLFGLTMTAFWVALIYVLIAEMGDKTQLVALAFATRFKAWIVLLGVFIATLLIHLLSVFAGELAGNNLPEFWVKLSAGIAFIIFGLWTIRGDTYEENEGTTARLSRFGPIATVAAAFFLAELGDKTMLVTITVASEQQHFIPVWIGSTIGMVIADAIAIIVGRLLGKRLPERVIKYSAAAVFAISGLYNLYAAWQVR